MKKIINGIILFYFLSVSGQVQYKKGYFIDEKNNRIECLIEDKNWINTPTEFNYKFEINDTPKTLSSLNCNEFQVYETGHFYIKKTYNLNGQKCISFLRVLVFGSANLYEYNNSKTGTYYFFDTENSLQIKELISISNEYDNGDNFKKILFENIYCENQSKKNIRNLKYEEDQLIKYFVDYNKCKGKNYTNFNDKHFKLNFKYGITAGYALVSAFDNFEILYNSYTAAPSAGGVEYPDKVILQTLKNNFSIYSFGTEFELFFKFNNLNWSFFSNPTYNLYNKKHSETINYKYGINYTTKADLLNFSFLEIPIGFRYYIFLNENSKLNIGIAHNMNIKISKNEIGKIETNGIIKIIENYESIPNTISFNMGYTFKDTYGISIIHHRNRNFEHTDTSNEIKNSMTLTLKYFF